MISNELLQLADRFYALAMKLDISGRSYSLPPEEWEKERPSGPQLKSKDPHQFSRIAILLTMAHRIYSDATELNKRLDNRLQVTQRIERRVPIIETKSEIIDVVNEVASLIEMARKEHPAESLRARAEALRLFTRKLREREIELDMPDLAFLHSALDEFLTFLVPMPHHGIHDIV